jgi:acetyl esterase
LRSNPESAAAFLSRLRQEPAAAAVDSEAVAEVYERDVAGRFKVRVYHPGNADALPILMFFHGGAWLAGDLESHDATCRRFANGASCVVVNVDYRLAPEHPFPSALDDCVDATLWAHANAAEIGGDPLRLGVAGISAGGNLAAALALKFRDDGGPRLTTQVLLYPVLDASMATESYSLYAEGFFLEREVMRWAWEQYVPDPAARHDPLASPSDADSLDGLPPAVFVTAECDPLRDEAELYADRLRRSGVSVRLRRGEGHVHGALRLVAVIADAEATLDWAVEATTDFL